MRRRRYENGPVRGFPVASSTCPASMLPRALVTRKLPSEWRSSWVTGACSAIRAPCRAAACASPTPNLPMCICALVFCRRPPKNLPEPTSARMSAAGTISTCGSTSRRSSSQVARQLVVVLRLGRELQLAGAHEVAGDVLLLHHRLDRIDSRRKGLVEGARFLRAETSGQRSEIVRQAAVAMTAVAAGRLADDAARFEHGHGRAALGQRQRRRQPGEARADDDHVGTSRNRSFGTAGERGCGIEPIGFQLHRSVLFFRRATDSESQTA